MCIERAFTDAATGRRVVLALLGLLIVGVLALPTVAAAQSVDAAKAAGSVGERFDGYLGVVTPDAPASVRQMVEAVNADRRQRYADIAARTGATVAEVSLLAGQKLVANAAPGEYVMGTDRRWVRR